MKYFLLGELRFYSRLVILSFAFILILHYVVVPGIVTGIEKQKQQVERSVKDAPRNLLDDLRKKVEHG